MTEVVVPTADLLARAVRTFMKTDADAAYLASPGTLVFVARCGEEVAGWCWGYRLVRPDGASMAYLHQVEVQEARRGQGIGRALLTAFMGSARAGGASKMFLTTGAGNLAARKLYEALGGGLATQGATVNYWFLL